jgi:hypothetical protein
VTSSPEDSGLVTVERLESETSVLWIVRLDAEIVSVHDEEFDAREDARDLVRSLGCEYVEIN